MPPLGFVAYLSLYVTAAFLVIPVTMFGGLGGGISGAWPEAELEYLPEIETTIRETLENYSIKETLRNFFLKEARARTSHTFAVVSEQGSQTAEEMVAQGMDTVLELSVQRIWLKRVDDQEGDMNPPMVLVLFVQARLVGGTEKTLWYDQTFVQETKKRPYKEWPYHYHFQADIEKAYQNLAKQLVNQLFLNTSNVS